jgi:hypothetical protein
MPATSARHGCMSLLSWASIVATGKGSVCYLRPPALLPPLSAVSARRWRRCCLRCVWFAILGVRRCYRRFWVLLP